MRTIAICTALLALASCGKGENDPGPGGVTVGEARALDEAAQMLDSRQPPPDLLRAKTGEPEVAATGSGDPAVE